MDEMQLVKDLRRSTPAITEDAEAIARTRLLSTLIDTEPAPQRNPSRVRKIAWRTAVAGALAATVAVGFTVVQNLGGSHASVADAAVVKVLDKAATAATARPFTAPRPDQWVYQYSRYISGPDPKTAAMHDDFYSWTRASDGLNYVREPGLPGLQKQTGPEANFPPRGYVTLSKLPTDPDALLRWIAEHRPSTPKLTDFRVLSGMLEDGGVLPPKVEVAIFEAIKRLPGVTIRKDARTFLGKPVIAIAGRDGGSSGGVPTSDEVLLDPVTYTFQGNDNVLAADLHLPAEPSKGIKPRTEKAGTPDSAGVVLQTGIVDKVGQKP